MIAICLLLCVGAFAKSAQVPLHTWLPDAMEGPTPVSSLIHAATMVTAGVYLIARMFPLFELAPTAADIAAFVGLATLLIAATIALAVTDLKRIIAYSTMSQIGYMIVGVSIGAYAGGLFMLMTHAFFKALLFMAAGSVIAAMANNQNIDRMSGFRRAMPFTSALLIVGCLALAGFPGTSGFFSKDEILGFAADRGGMYWIFAIGGYVGALLTAFYAFRIGFRVVAGPPCEEAKELEGGHLAPRASRRNPHTGEAEDTDVGFPGPEHHIAEREWPMKVAMAVLGVRRAVRRPDPDPRASTDVVDDVPRRHLRELGARTTIEPSTADAWIGLAIGGAISIAGIALAYSATCAAPGVTVRLAERFRRLHGFLLNKWYFDELIDALVYRPAIAIGRFANAVFERVVVAGHRRRHDRGGQGRGLGRPRRPVGLRPRLRAAADRRLRRARHLLPGGERADAERRCSGRRWSPGCSCLLAAAARGALVAVLGALVTLGLAIGLVADFDAGAAGLQHVVDESWIPDLGVRYQLGVDGISVFLVLLTALLWFAVTLWSALRDEPGDGRAKLYYFLVGLAGTAALGAFLAQDLLLFVLFFDLMLIPFFFLIGTFGGEQPDRGDDEDDRLHAGRLAADAGRRDRDRDPRLRRRSASSLLDPGAAAAPALERQPGVDLLLLRRRLPGQDAGLPDPRLDARRLPRGAAAGADPALGGALEGRRLRLPAGRAAALPRRDRRIPGGDAC